MVVPFEVRDDKLQDSTTGSTSPWAAQQGPLTNRRGRAITASIWVGASVASSYMLRLVSTLVLTRLLFPEVFGLFAFVTIVMNVLNMFSDLGINVAVMRSKRADEHFINCAWTVRLLRGGVLWVGALLLAWPVSVFFEQPTLVALIPIVALSAIIDPLGSPSIWFCNRKLRLWPMFWRDNFVGLSVLLLKIILAIHLQSVWALVFAGLFGSTLRAVSSYTILSEIRPRLVWDKKVVGGLVRFGGWLFVSSMLTFFVQQGDKLILGKMFDAEVLGIYVVALTIPAALLNLIRRMNSNVLLPVYADLVHHDDARLRRRVLQSRACLMVLGGGPAVLLAIFGQHVIDFLYDPRYAAAGWMLQIASLGALAMLINLTITSILLPAGDSLGMFQFQAFRSICFIVCMTAGGWFFGFLGLVAGVAASNLMSYPAAAWLGKRHGVLHVKLDLAAYVLSIAFVAIGWYFVGFPRVT